MDQIAIGRYIARKRKEQNLTQEQLSEQLGVSNKTISKWENGLTQPEYSVFIRLLLSDPYSSYYIYFIPGIRTKR